MILKVAIKITVMLLVFTFIIMCYLFYAIITGKDEKIALKNLVIEHIEEKLNKHNVQVVIALGNNFEAKKNLLLSPKLNSDGLLALCINPEPLNIKNHTIQDYFKTAIKNAELSKEQQVQLAKIGEAIYSIGLLSNPHLTAEGLVAICEHSENLNLKNDTVLELFNNAINNTVLTEKQQIQIAESDIEGVGLF